MNEKLIEQLKSKNAKLFVVDAELEELIKKLSTEMQTSSHDVVLTAIKLLSKSINKKIILRDPITLTDIEISALEDIKPSSN